MSIRTNGPRVRELARIQSESKGLYSFFSYAHNPSLKPAEPGEAQTTFQQPVGKERRIRLPWQGSSDEPSDRGYTHQSGRDVKIPEESSTPKTGRFCGIIWFKNAIEHRTLWVSKSSLRRMPNRQLVYVGGKAADLPAA